MCGITEIERQEFNKRLVTSISKSIKVGNRVKQIDGRKHNIGREGEVIRVTKFRIHHSINKVRFNTVYHIKWDNTKTILGCGIHRIKKI